uniref:Type III potassium channel toxin protein n=1 Tax=Anemonia sulcata TaxID=6108 RepID=A0A0S1M194_ANESU|nr:type III potassium channel toxin protein [Anemonia sulcata]
MSAQRFLLLLVVTSLIAASLAAPKEVQLTKRAGKPCDCGNKKGIYWIISRCPSGYGYTGSCGYFIGTCCY